MDERLTLFKAANDKMIAMSDKSYSKYISTEKKKIGTYTKKQINDIIYSSSNALKAKLSYDFFQTNGWYSRILIDYATLPKYYGIVLPKVNQAKKITDKEISKKYYDSLTFIDNMSIPQLFYNVTLSILIYGVYYGVINQIDKETFSYIDLPFNYCRTRYKNYDNVSIIEFNLHYFDTMEPEAREAALSIYPDEIVEAYNNYQKIGSKLSYWYQIPTEIGMCFYLYDQAPLFLSTIEQIIYHKESLDIDRQKAISEIKKVMVQKIPHTSDGKLLFEPPEAEEFHRGAVDMLKNNTDISVLTTYADVTIEGSETTNASTAKSNIEKTYKNIYDTAGVSPQLFSATGNLALDSSIKNDLALLMPLLESYSNFITYLLSTLFGNNMISFKYQMLPISMYNDDKYIDETFKLASMGYSVLLPFIAAGIPQKYVTDLKDLENDLLKLGDKLVPLTSAFNSSGEQVASGTGSSSSKVGAPKKSSEQKSPRTLANEKSLDGGGKSK